jgi:hypothetical protein
MAQEPEIALTYLTIRAEFTQPGAARSTDGARMNAFGTLTLVAAGAGDGRDIERVAAFARDARSFGFLYTAEDAACIALADCIGDRLWLSPRCHLGLGAGRALLELVRSHRYERVVAVVPAAQLETTLASLRRAEPRTRMLRVDDVPGLVEVSIEAPVFAAEAQS